MALSRRVQEIADALRSFPGIRRKSSIAEIVTALPTAGFGQVVAAEGEDAAVLDAGDSYILFAADGIMESLLNDSPYYAGYFSVLVNVNDIAAMGGRPLGMTDIMAIPDDAKRSEVIRGMAEGVRKFGVPFVGGHTHPDSSSSSLGVSVVGTVSKDAVLLSSTAVPGDDVVFVSDTSGHFPDEVPYAYVTTEGRSDDIVRRQLETVAEIGEKHLAHACKDISNPGCIGTLGMMLESSGVGATVDLDSIPSPGDVDEVRWLEAYLGCGFVFSCDPSCSGEIIRMFADVCCEGAVVGKIDDSRLLRITDGIDTETVLDLSKEGITGIAPDGLLKSPPLRCDGPESAERIGSGHPLAFAIKNGQERLATEVDTPSRSKFTISLLDPATPQTSVVRSEAAPVRT